MADLTVANSTYSSGTLDSASTLVNNVDGTDAQHVNGPNSAIIQIETVLGTATDLTGSLTDLAERLAVSLNGDGTLVLDDYLWETGDICMSFRDSKTGWLVMDGTERSNTTYETLLTQVISKIADSANYTIKPGTAVSGVTVDHTTNTFTKASHGLGNNTVIYFMTSSSYPTNVSGLTKYYIVNTATNTFQISTTLGGAALDMTGNGTGWSIYTTFICDARGVFPLGADNMGGSSRNRTTQGNADGVGQGAGSESSVAAHTHGVTDGGHTHGQNIYTGGAATYNSALVSGLGGNSNDMGPSDSATTGISVDSSGTSTGNLPPFFTVNYFIKT